MTEKCYNLKLLQKYKNNPFIYEYKSENIQETYKYDIIIQEVNKCIEYFQQNEIENEAGIAINLKEHTTPTCILLLGILNHNCHFYCLDVEDSSDVGNNLRLSAVKYIISKEILMPELVFYNHLNGMRVLNEIFHIGMVKACTENIQRLRLCYTIATSGSTGLPKIVHVPYESVEPNIKSLRSLLKLQQDDVIYLGSPPTFDPFVVELFMALETGAALLLIPKEIRLQPNNLLKILFPLETTIFEGITILQTTSSLFRLFDKESIHDIIFNTKSPLRCLILGGEEFPFLAELKTWLPEGFSLCGKRIFNIYGITEVSCWSTVYELELDKYLEIKRVPLGKSLDDYTLLRIIDESGNTFSTDCCKGELTIGSSMRRCFIPLCDKNINIMTGKDIIYRSTGDLVERDSSGNIYYIGRTNNVIKRLGKRLCLDSLAKKIENILSSNTLPSYKIVCLWHKETTKIIVYVNSPSTSSTVKQTILHLLKENLEKHEQPNEIYYNTELPLNQHGKIDRGKIMENILTEKENQNKSPLEIFKDFLENVMGIKSRELKVDHLHRKRLKSDVNISFTHAGGTSFQALSLSTQIGDLLKTPKDQRKILELLLDHTVTIQDILQFLSSIPHRLETDTHDLSFKNTNDLSHSFKLLWRQDFKKCIDSSPKIYQEKFLTVGSHSHLLLTLNPVTGSEVSNLELPDRIECSVVFVSCNLALVGCYDGFLYGLNFQEGSILWKINLNGMIKAKPLVIDNIIIVGSYAEEFNVMAFDMKSLQCLWKLKFGLKGIFSSPLNISEESVLICSLDGSYAALEINSGSIKWLQKLELPIFSTPAKIESSDDVLLVLAEVKGQIIICNADSGEKITSYQADGNIFSGLTLHQYTPISTFIIFGCHDKNLYCLNYESTHKKITLSWKFSLNSAIYSTPIILSQRYILTCSTKGLIVLLDLETSNLKASYDLKAEIFSTPCSLRDKFVYVGARDNFLYAFELE